MANKALLIGSCELSITTQRQIEKALFGVLHKMALTACLQVLVLHTLQKFFVFRFCMASRQWLRETVEPDGKAPYLVCLSFRFTTDIMCHVPLKK
eukprot:jgi/Botrbrau1/7559/Bobra.0159s0009.1